MEELVTVATYHSPTLAEIAQARLREDGIQAVLENSNAIAMNSLLSFAVGGVKLKVARSDFAIAASILEEIDLQRSSQSGSTSDEPIRFHCSECRAVLEFPATRRGGVETCQRCGEYIDVPDRSQVDLAGSHVNSDLAEPAARLVPLWLEILGVLSFVYLPNLIYALPLFDSGWDLNFDAQLILLLVMSIQSAVPLLVILALCREGWEKFGITRFRWLLDCSLAAGLWIVLNIVTMFYDASRLAPAQPADVVPEPTSVMSWPIGLLCILSLAANSIAEELAMRGYLITRLEELWRSRLAAIATSSFLFASYHIYQGLPEAILAGLMGLIYGLFFCWARRLWPLVIAHTLHNAMLYFNM